MKRGLCVFTIILSVILMQSVAFATESVDISRKPLQVQFVIDASGSMQSTNENLNVLETVKLLASLNSNDDISFGWVAFNSNVLSSASPTLLDESSILAMHTSLDSIRFRGDTDIGLGLKEAYSLLQNKPIPNANQIMIFLSDGETDLPVNAERTNKNSEQDVLEIISQARDAEIPIYCIGLANNEETRNYLEKISSGTGAGSYINTTSPDDLLDAIQQIISRYTFSEFRAIDVDSETLSISPLNNKAKTNLVILSSRNLLREEIEASGYDNSLLSKHHYLYTISAGSELHVNLPRYSRYQVYRKDNLSFNGKLEIDTNYSNSTLKFYFADGATPIYDEELYKSITGHFIVCDANGAHIEDVPVVFDADGLHASYIFEYGKSYQIGVRFSNPQTNYTGDASAIYTMSLAPTPRPVPGKTYTFWNAQDGSIPLSDFDISQDDILELSMGTSKYVKLNIENDTIMVSPIQSGKSKVQILAVEQSGGEQLITFEINIVPFWEYTPAMIGLFILVALLIIIAFITYRQAKRRSAETKQVPIVRSKFFTGSITGYFIKLKSQNDILPMKWLLAEFSNRSEISLYDLLITSEIHEELPEAKNIFFSPGQDGLLQVSHNTNCTLLVHNAPLQKNVVEYLYYNDKFYITFEDGITEMEIYYRKVKAKAS